MYFKIYSFKMLYNVVLKENKLILSIHTGRRIAVMLIQSSKRIRSRYLPLYSAFFLIYSALLCELLGEEFH